MGENYGSAMEDAIKENEELAVNVDPGTCYARIDEVQHILDMIAKTVETLETQGYFPAVNSQSHAPSRHNHSTLRIRPRMMLSRKYRCSAPE